MIAATFIICSYRSHTRSRTNTTRPYLEQRTSRAQQLSWRMPKWKRERDPAPAWLAEHRSQMKTKAMRTKMHPWRNEDVQELRPTQASPRMNKKLAKVNVHGKKINFILCYSKYFMLRMFVYWSPVDAVSTWHTPSRYDIWHHFKTLILKQSSNDQIFVMHRICSDFYIARPTTDMSNAMECTVNCI